MLRSSRNFNQEEKISSRTLSVAYPIPTGSWLGLLGGGQLGRMFCHAAQSLGYRVALLDPKMDSPAATVADLHVNASHEDSNALAYLAKLCSSVTIEFENIPISSLKNISRCCLVSPPISAVSILQNRISEKRYVSQQGLPTVPYIEVYSQEVLQDVPPEFFPGLLKLAKTGYDGKGQVYVNSYKEAMRAFSYLGNDSCILEAFVEVSYEISVVLARTRTGEVVIYPVARNKHEKGILTSSLIEPALSNVSIQKQAIHITELIAEKLDYHGVICVEFFVLANGKLVVNEVAPRPHNSGHYTLDACLTSQFEQQARVAAGLPLGSAKLFSPAIMLNVLGNIWSPSSDSDARLGKEPNWTEVLMVPNTKIYLYNKHPVEYGRKMGHITIVADTIDQVRDSARRVAGILGISVP